MRSACIGEQDLLETQCHCVALAAQRDSEVISRFSHYHEKIPFAPFAPNAICEERVKLKDIN